MTNIFTHKSKQKTWILVKHLEIHTSFLEMPNHISHKQQDKAYKGN